MKKALRLAWEPTDVKLMLGYVYAVLGERGEAQKILEEIQNRSTREYVSPFYMAVLYLGMEDWDRCMYFIEKSIEDKSAEMETLLNDPVFEKIESNPKLEVLLNKVGVSINPSKYRNHLQEGAINVRSS